MALSIGELVGYVNLDTSGAESTAGGLTGKFEGFGGKWGKALAGAGAAAAAAGAAAIGAAVLKSMENEAITDKLAASLGKGSKASETYGEMAGNLYSAGFGTGMEDVSTAIGAVVSSIKGMRNASESEVEAMTEKALTFSDVMGIDVTRAAQVAGTMIHTGLAKNGSDAFDLLMKASQKVPVQLREDVLDATEEYGQFFTQLGIDGPAAMDILAKGAEKGMYGIDKAGDAVKEFTIRATDMSALSKSAYKSIGLDAGKMANDILAGGDKAKGATDKILDGLLSMKPGAKQANAAIALFGTPLEDLSTKDIPKFLSSLQGSEQGLGKWSGAVDKAGKVAYDNAATNLSMFGRTLKTQFVEVVGGQALPIIRKLSAYMASELGPTIDKVAGWFRDKFMPAMRKAAQDVLPALKEAFNEVKGALKDAEPLYRMLGRIITNVVIPAVVFLVKKVLPTAVKSQMLLLRGAGKLASGLQKAWNGIKKAVSAVGKFFTQKLPEFFNKAWSRARDITSKVSGKIIGFVRAIPGKFRSGLSSLRGIVSNLFSGAMNKGFDLVKSIGGKIRDSIAGIPGKLLSLGGKFGSAGRSILQSFIDGMRNAAGIISGIAGNVWDTVRGLLNGAISRINSALEFNINTPGPGGISINPPDIPQLATGGRATRETLAVIGEGREPESVLPDSVLRGLLERAHESGRQSARGDAGRNAPLIGAVYQQPGESAAVLSERLYFASRTRG